ncbi:MAG: tetraacyldisaccharide 4'-kinase [Planctomycetota bacterium]|nr:MAG: tetraacyldisaccharide 4'-kinase [Planctomycetota bacterium]
MLEEPGLIFGHLSMSPAQLKTYFHLISGRSRGPFAFMARSLLAIASGGYAIATFLRNKSYDWNFNKTVTVNAPIISIGNATTGGTGKTPMVEYVARHFRDQGRMVSILSRGYGSSEHGGMNDEGLLLYQNLPDVPHLQGPDRAALAQVAVEELLSELLILDDGLQHRRLRRSLDILLIDATNPFGFGWLLPRGLLREPLKQALRRADVILLTRSDLVTDQARTAIRTKVNRLSGSPKLWVESAHKPVELLMADRSEMALSELNNKTVAIFSGLGNPAAFRQSVEQLGAKVIAEQSFPDHHPYSEADLASLSRWVAASGADLALTSQKDLVKLPIEQLGGKPLGAIRIGLHILQGKAELLKALDQAFAASTS